MGADRPRARLRHVIRGHVRGSVPGPGPDVRGVSGVCESPRSAGLVCGTVRTGDVKNQAVSAPVLVDVRYATVRADVARLEDVYEQHGAKLWRAVFLYAGDREIANDGFRAGAQERRRPQIARALGMADRVSSR